MLNIVVPMAGQGTRFRRAGFSMPKPLIPVGDKSMIEVVIGNLRPARPHRFFFVCQREHLRGHDLEQRLRSAAPGCHILPLEGVTEGATCTVLTARDHIDNDEPLMIANCDQFVDASIDEYLGEIDRPQLGGLIMTMTADHPKWSFVALDQQGLVTRVAEKEAISNEATVGIYNFKHGRDFVRAAERMIEAQERVNGEFYVAPVYNHFIAMGGRVGVFNVGSEGKGMHGLGVPEDLATFLCRDDQQHWA